MIHSRRFQSVKNKVLRFARGAQSFFFLRCFLILSMVCSHGASCLCRSFSLGSKLDNHVATARQSADSSQKFHPFQGQSTIVCHVLATAAGPPRVYHPHEINLQHDMPREKVRSHPAINTVMFPAANNPDVCLGQGTRSLQCGIAQMSPKTSD